MEATDFSLDDWLKLDLSGLASFYLAIARAKQEADIRSGKRSAESLLAFSSEKVRRATVIFPDASTITKVSSW